MWSSSACDVPNLSFKGFSGSRSLRILYEVVGHVVDRSSVTDFADGDGEMQASVPNVVREVQDAVNVATAKKLDTYYAVLVLSDTGLELL